MEYASLQNLWFYSMGQVDSSLRIGMTVVFYHSTFLFLWAVRNAAAVPSKCQQASWSYAYPRRGECNSPVQWPAYKLLPTTPPFGHPSNGGEFAARWIVGAVFRKRKALYSETQSIASLQSPRNWTMTGHLAIQAYNKIIINCGPWACRRVHCQLLTPNSSLFTLNSSLFTLNSFISIINHLFHMILIPPITYQQHIIGIHHQQVFHTINHHPLVVV